MDKFLGYFSAAQSDEIYTIRYDKQTGKTETIKKQGEIKATKFPAFSEPYRRIDCPFFLTNNLCGGGDFGFDYCGSEVIP